MKRKILTILSVVSVVCLCLSALPMSTSAVSDVPADMLDNVYLDALAFAGYKVQSQINDGTIYVKYARNIPPSVLSGIGYGTGPSGLETVSADTKTGKAPDIAKFKSQGLCCASYVSYVYYNYLPNIAGIDTSSMARPTNPRLAASFHEAANGWVSSGKARRISFTQSGSTFAPAEKIPVGSLMVFKNPSDGRIAHVAIYAGAYDGKHFVTHVSDEQGPEIGTVEWLIKGNEAEAVVQIVVPQMLEANGKIEVRKKDTGGNNLAGAVFVATNTATGVQYPIGPTDQNGYAASQEGLPYGTYTVKETVFPKGYKASGETTRTVTLNAQTQTVVIGAVNEQIKGRIRVSKTGEVFASVREENGVYIPVFAEKGLQGATFNILSSDGTVADTLQTDETGTAESKELPLGEYLLEETGAPYGFLPDTVSREVSLTSSDRTQQVVLQTVTVKNTRQKARIILTKTLETDTHYALGTNGEIANVTYGLFAEETMTAYDGKTVPKDGLLETAVPDASGNLTFTADLPMGTKVYAKELSTDLHYVLSEWMFPLEITYEPHGKETVNITVHDGEPILNRLKRGVIEVHKTDEKGNPLAGAIFGLFSPGDEQQTEETALQILFTDEDGICRFGDVPYGDWIVKELFGVEGYAQDAEPVTVPLREDGETVSVAVVNERIITAVPKGSGSDKKEILPLESYRRDNVPKSPKTGDPIIRYVAGVFVLLLSVCGMLLAHKKLSKERRK